MVMWNTNDKKVGEKVLIYTGYGKWETATVIAVAMTNANLQVRSEDGEILIGDQWDDV